MRIQLTAVAVLAIAAVSCGDNPVVPQEHFEARGVVVRLGDSTHATVDSNHVTGGILIDTVDRPRTYDVLFIDEDGEIGRPPGDPDAGRIYGLAASVADTTIASVSAVDDVAWTITLVGRRAGSTAMTIRLLHGGHDDFVSLAIPIVVAP